MAAVALMVRVRLILAIAVAVVALGATPARASLADEVAAGQEVAQRLQAGDTSCTTRSDADFEHLGEYVMERMLGSRAAHRAMNDRMTAMLGDADTERMHALMGRRYAGCGTHGARAGMMGGLAWMRDGSWRHMSRADFKRAGAEWMGPGMMSRTDGWSTAAVLAVVLAVGALVMYAVLKRPWRRDRSPGPAAT